MDDEQEKEFEDHGFRITDGSDEDADLFGEHGDMPPLEFEDDDPDSRFT